MPATLRVGLALLPNRSWAEAQREWAKLEAAGFDHGWTYDHISWDGIAGGPWFSAVPTLAAAAGVTDAVELGALVFTPNLHHPVALAQELVTVADISGGRLVAGVGAGGTGTDARMLGQPALTPPERVARLSEFLAVLERLLVYGRAEHRGAYFHAVEARCSPTRADGVPVPTAVAGNGPRTIELAVRYGDAWVTDGRLAPTARTDDSQAFRDGIAGLAAQVAQACQRAARPENTLRRIFLVGAGPEAPLSRPGALVETCAAYAAMGFTDVVVHAPRAGSPFAAPHGALERAVADELQEARALEVAAHPGG